MTQLATVADQRILHCFKCREPRTYTRMLASRPVYACDGCGNTREIEELGVGAIRPPSILAVMEKEKQKPKPQGEVMSDKSPLQLAINEAVDAAVSPLKEEIAGIKGSIEELVSDAINKMLSPGGQRPAASSSVGGECRHKNFMRKCESCQAKHKDD